MSDRDCNCGGYTNDGGDEDHHHECPVMKNGKKDKCKC